MLEGNRSYKKQRKNTKSLRKNKNSRVGASSLPPITQSNKINKLDEEFEGIEIHTYAAKNNTHVGDIWKKIRSGNLLARSEKGALLIYQKAPSPLVNLKEIEEESRIPIIPKKLHEKKQLKERIKNKAEPELPIIEEFTHLDLPDLDLNKDSAFNEQKLVEVSNSLSKSPEVALLLDHLSLAKEENREILRLTRDTIENVTKMSEKIVSLKDEIIEGKNFQLESLKEKMEEQERAMKKLSQKNEDLEMLNKTISSDS